jgi:hypothetical protein
MIMKDRNRDRLGLCAVGTNMWSTGNVNVECRSLSNIDSKYFHLRYLDGHQL